ncbi:MAG: Rieske 2Fe-2S domain-containing protein [Fimbriimonadaceae bacterium]|nr:Rieske 2Fe-2S domain-containing protein [Fimbriimonadaceae bacterium]
MNERLRQDFPIDWEEDHYVSRREFFKFMTLASGGLAAGSVGMAAWAAIPKGERTFEAVRLTSADSIAIGGSLAFRYPRQQDICLLIRREDGSFVAFSQRCTHLSCPVEYQSDKDRLYCPCHNGAFSAKDGSVLQGPPPHPLPQILLEVREGDVYAVGVRHGGEA